MTVLRDAIYVYKTPYDLDIISNINLKINYIPEALASGDTHIR